MSIFKDVPVFAEEALDVLDDTIVGYEDLERQLEGLVDDFINNAKGQCAFLEGRANSGRESLLRKVLKKQDLDLRVVNVGYLASDQTVQESLGREDDGEKWIFLVRGLDDPTAHQQDFFYTLVDKAAQNSWLIFITLSKEDFGQCIEKRGNSRMPRIKLTFEQAENLEKYCEAFRNLMIPPNFYQNGNISAQYECYFAFVNSLNASKWLSLFYEFCDYHVLKQFVAQILQSIADFQYSEEELTAQIIQEILEDAAAFVNPNYNSKILPLFDLSLRAQCVFLCAHRVLKNRPLDGKLSPHATYRTVFLEYKKLVNTHFNMLDVRSDVYIFHEIDHLVELGLLKSDERRCIADKSAKKVWLNVDKGLVDDYEKQLKLPTKVRDFFSTIAK